MSPDEFRLKTGLLGFTPGSLNIIFSDLDGRAADVFHGKAPVPDRVGAIVAAWWEEVITAVDTMVREATSAWEATGAPAQLTSYATHAALPKHEGAYASSIQAWDYHLGLIIRALDQSGIPHQITTITG